jgi:hypothetical protein
VADGTWDGKKPFTLEGDLPPGVLREGGNELAVENVGDTPAAYSMVFLDRFEVRYPRLLAAERGVLEGSFGEPGVATVPGLPAGSFVVDTTSASAPRWMRGASSTASGFAFRAEAAHPYLAVAPGRVLHPDVRKPMPSSLKRRKNVAEYLLIAPRAFLGAAQPLVELRRAQGLRSRAVALEEIVQEFGHGEAHPAAVKEFLEYAHQRWSAPALRYVLLLGDATYDPKDFLHTGVADRVPALMVKTSYLWTASDPSFARVNGDDLLPDLAIGRLPAASVDEARVMIGKVVAFEQGRHDLQGSAVLVADNADVAGDFEQDADDIARSVLGGRNVEKVYLREAGGASRSLIGQALDGAPALVSYIGHGGIAVWASENIWNNRDVSGLASQTPETPLPLLFTMNCLNGYFHFPSLDSLSEAFLKAEGRGAVAAFSPSGLSVDAPAHVYHQALLGEIVSGRHGRIGDAVMAAQAAYADSGVLPELLGIYHFFGDPAMTIR